MKTNLSFLIILFVAVVTFINDIIIYVFKLDYLISLIISFLIGLCLFIFLCKKKKIEIENYFCKWDLIFLGLFLAFTVIKIVTPDFNYDSVNYHYYNQKYPFIDKINFDFLVAGGKVSDWVYPLADRMNYIFRYLLGIRLGTMLNYFSIVVIFYEVKKNLKNFVPDINPVVQIICASFPISIPIIFRFTGTYYIDNYSTIFLLEIFYIGIKEKEIFKQKGMLYNWFLICGIAVGIKISNLVLIIPIGINIIYNNIKLFKELKIKDYIISIILFFLPFSIYGINNLVQMSNFFYPFLGMKKYYPMNVWNDPSFGIPNFLSSFIWPIIVAFVSSKGHDEKTLIELIWAFGYVFLIINLLIKIFEKKPKDDLFRLELITFIGSVLWANFLNGYCRYATVLPILFVLNISANFSNNINNKNISNKILYWLQEITLIIIFLVTLIGTREEFLENVKIFRENAVNIFRDNNYTLHIDGVWGCIGDTGGIISLLREENTPIYNLENKYIKNSKYLYEKYKSVLIDKDIYIIIPIDIRDKIEAFQTLEEENFEVIEKVDEYDSTKIPYMDYLGKWELYKVKYLGDI